MPDTVEEMCPEMPRLDKLLKDVNDVSESGARYSDMPQVGRKCIQTAAFFYTTVTTCMLGASLVGSSACIGDYKCPFNEYFYY